MRATDGTGLDLCHHEPLVATGDREGRPACENPKPEDLPLTCCRVALAHRGAGSVVALVPA